jgi:hypothetical protein
MVYNTQNYRNFGLCPSSSILKNGEQSSVEVALFQGLNRVSCLPLHLRTETDPVSETLCSLIFKIPDDGLSPNLQ